MATPPTDRFKFCPRPQGTIKEFDGEDQADGSCGEPAQTALVLPSAANVPGHLLFIALLEHLCSLYEPDAAKNKMLFTALCEQLREGGVIISLPILELDELAVIRSQYKLSFTRMLQRAVMKLKVKNTPLMLWERLSLFMQQKFANSVCRDDFGFNISRCRDEFVELGVLGSGAYGCVYKMRHKLDGREYAVKKIPIAVHNAAIWYKIRREVEVLAQLSHQHIVRYYSSWLEFQEHSSRRRVDQDGAPRLLRALSYGTDSSSSSSTSVVLEARDRHPCREGEERERLPCFEESPSYSASTETALVRSCIVLYIRMELCSCSLWRWISDRNERTAQLSDVLSIVDEETMRRMSLQLLEAVQHLHAENIIHRDITLKNIFLVNGEVKVGDFGLARDRSASPLLTPDPGRSGVDEHFDADSLYTSGIGTTTYAAPEQINGSDYDSKADMFSVGICIYEFHQPFYTTMERHKSLQNLRNQEPLSDSFVARWPKHAGIIRDLTLTDPKLRPSAEDVLRRLQCGKQETPDVERELGEMQRDAERGRALLAEREEEVASLRRLIAERDRTIAERDRTIAKLTAHASLDTRHASLDTPPASLDTALALLDIRHASLDTRHASLDMQHTSLDTALASLDTPHASLDT